MSSLPLLPQPKRCVVLDDHFVIDQDTWIVLPVDATPACTFSARQLQHEIEDATGLRLDLVKTTEPARTENVIVLADSPAGLTDYDRPPQLPADASVPDQAYAIRITAGAVLVLGASADALHWAVQTLRQIVRTVAPRLPCVEIEDWPTLAKRGLMLDVSRAKVPTVATLKLMVDHLSLFKMNVLQLYTEHTFQFPHHPRIGMDCGSYSGDDMIELDAYARERHVELMPNLQSFGHASHILSLPEYKHLAELDALGWSLCPGDEGTYDLLGDMYADLLPAFTSRTLNINCDETWDLGVGRSQAACEERGRGRVYLDHILRLREMAAEHGCTIQLWGDILLHYPELVPELPDDVTLLDWHYGAADDYPSVRVFAESGRRYWVCPGTSSWNTLFPRVENSNANIRVLAQLAAEHGAEGMLNTDWGDNGHYQPLGQCWYGYAYGAEQAWTGGATGDAAFDAALGAILLGEDVVAAMRDLGRLNVLPGMPLRNATNSIFALLDEPLVGELADTMPPETLNEIVATCATAVDTFRGALVGSRCPLALEEMAFSARLMAFAARKVLVSQKVRACLGGLSAELALAGASLQTCARDMRDVEVELIGLRAEFEALWLCRARRSEIHVTLDHLDNLRARYGTAQAWISERLAQCERGETPSVDLSDYVRLASGYEILGQTFHRRMRETGVRF